MNKLFIDINNVWNNNPNVKHFSSIKNYQLAIYNDLYRVFYNGKKVVYIKTNIWIHDYL